MRYYFLVIINIGIILGIIFGLYFKESIVLFLSIFVILTRLFKFERSLYIILIIGMICGYVTINIKEKSFDIFIQEMTKTDKISNIYATVISNKEEGKYSDKYTIKLISNNKNLNNKDCLFRLKKEENKQFEYGDTILLSGYFDEPVGEKNEGGFDYKSYLKTIDVYGIIESRYKDVKIIKQNNLNYINLLANNTKISFMNQLEKIYTENQEELKNLLTGITLGIKDELTKEQVDNFKKSNLSHILAISGMHVGYVVIATLLMFKLLRIPRKVANVLSIGIIIFFMFLTNFTPSVVRAGIMGILILIAYILKRKPNIWIAISIASIISLTSNPYTLMSLSFQLSYLGTIGIVLGMKVAKRKEIKTNYIKDIVIVCISAQLFVAPVLLWNFNTVTPYFLVSNIIVSPIIGVIMILGYILIFISYISINLVEIFNYAEVFLLHFLNNTTKIIGELPYAIIYLKTPYLTTVAVYYILLSLYIIYTDMAKKIAKIVVVVYIVIIIALNLKLGQLELYFVDVGQGDCSLVITETYKTLLIDGGGSLNPEYDVGESITLPYLVDKKITKLDYIMISHFDSDHVQGVFFVLENLKVENVIISIQDEEYENLKRFMNIVKEKNINVIIVEKGDVLYLDKYNKLEILYPEPDNLIKENAINNNSIVCKLVNKSISVLYTGDIEEVAEKRLVKLYKDTDELKADVLKCAHHGSKSSSIPEFIDLVQPKLVTISCGVDNSFGHPAKEVLNRFEVRGVVIRRTDIEGEVKIN